MGDSTPSLDLLLEELWEEKRIVFQGYARGLKAHGLALKP